MVLRNDNYRDNVIYALESLPLYAFSTYLKEKYYKSSYLKRYRINEDFRAIINILGDVIEGIIIIDQADNVLYSNESVSKILGVEGTKVLNTFEKIKVKSITTREGENITASHEGEKTLLNSFKEITQHLCKESPERLLKKQRSEYLPGPQQKFILVEGLYDSVENNETIRNFHIKIASSFYQEKNVVVLNITDTTDRDAIISLKDNNNYKTRMLASVSHELRTPLNGSINFIDQALTDPDVPQTVKDKFLFPAIRSNKLLLSLINDILDFSQMEANKLRLVFETKNVVDTAKECIELLEIQAKKKGIDLTLESSLSESEQQLSTDHNRLKQIILNLLSNAVKFTFTGSVTLKLEEVKKTTTRTRQINDRVRGAGAGAGAGGEEEVMMMTVMRRGIKISCRDTGIGISEENKKKLFKAFEKIELGDETAINSTGAGLGLVIANNLAQRLNGGGGNEFGPESSEKICIKFESVLDRGSCFYFEIFDQGFLNQTTMLNKLNKKIVLRARSPINLSSISLLDIEEGGIKNINVSCYNNQNILNIFPNKLLQGINSSDDMSSKHFLLENSEIDLISKTRSIRDKKVPCSCPKVLIVDDDCFNLTALEMNLAKLKIKSDSAFNGLQALQKIKMRQMNRCSSPLCSQYKLIFLDCNMPVMDGYETASKVKEAVNKGEVDQMIIIACTAFVQQSEIERAIKAGMDDYCIKPITLSMISEKLKTIGLDPLTSTFSVRNI